MKKAKTSLSSRDELEDVKNRFISNVTHELRTPVVAMQKSIAVLMEQAPGPLNETQMNFLNLVSRNLNYLQHLVEDLLDVAKIQAGRMSIRKSPARLDKVVRDVCDSLQTWATSKNLRVVREIDGGLPEVSLDAEKITQVLNNLVGNAVKFTPSGGRIVVRVCRRPDQNEVEVAVSDTGTGIARGDLKKLFGRFQQFGKQQGITGTGLGLSISKEIIQRHGGRISAESRKNEGSTFTFTLPLNDRKR